MATVLELKTNDLAERLRVLERVIVAYSGGVDSAVLAVAASKALGSDALAVTAVSPSLARREREAAARLAAAAGFTHHEVSTHELDRPEYVRNESDRCFWCKTELFEVLRPLAQERSATIAVGTNLDDLGDHRPGIQAARINEVATPLVDAGFSKDDVRELARAWNLPVSEKPASPCLASRFAYGVSVSAEGLERVDRAEEALRALGFEVLRVRDHGDLARVEVPLDDIERAAGLSSSIASALKELGFKFVTLDLAGFRSGSLNDVLAPPQIRSSPDA